MQKKNSIFLATIFIISAGIYTITARAINFQVVLNDFWTVFYYARNLNFSTPASLHNSLFPIGYATILSLMPVRHALWMAFYLNIGLAAAAVAATSALAFTENNLPRAILVALVSIFYPLTFKYSNTTGPDIGVATFIAIGIYFLWQEHLYSYPKNPKVFGYLSGSFAGASLALASLWRSHAIVAAVAILLVYAGIMGIKTLWQRKMIIIAFILVAGIQVLINLIAGHGATENAQYFNIYKTFFGNDWLTIPKDANNSLLFNLLLTKPITILTEYLPNYWAVSIYAWPGVALFFLGKKNIIKKFAAFAALTVIMYAIPVAFGSSPRAPIAITPLAFASFGFLVTEIYARSQVKRTLQLTLLAIFATIAVFFALQWHQINTQFISEFSDQHERYLRIERLLRNNGLTSPDEVFTNSFNFYLPITPPYQPRFNGGWDTSILWHYRTEYPEIPVGSWEEFSAACKASGIRFLALTPYSYELAPFFGDLYKGEFIPDDIVILKFIGNFQIIMFK